VFDSANESIYLSTSGTSVFNGSGLLTDQQVNVSGGFPLLRPNQTNRFYLIVGSQGGPTGLGSLQNHDKTLSDSITVSYWPRYLYARPATT